MTKLKFNAAHVAGSVVIAAVVGAFAQSWILFLLIAAALIIASFCSGEIWLPKQRDKS